MSIYKYKEGDHKSGFIGFRVAVKVGDDYRQKYFNLRKATQKSEIIEAEKAAKKLNTEWNFERELIANQRKLECKEAKNYASSIYNTGVLGIKMKYSANSKKKVGRKKPKKYYTPVFMVSGSTNSKKYFKQYNILTQGYDWAWMKAVQFYAEEKGIKHFSHLLERKPPVEKFIVIHRYVCGQGHDIPLSRLPNELAEHKEEPLT